jgi:RNA polymerase sigma factor for flagellar operon FliA
MKSHARSKPLAPQALAKRNSLIEEYSGYARNVAKMMLKRHRLPPELFDEVLAAANLGLVEAAAHFKARKDVEFRSYAFLRIRGAIIDSLRIQSDLSRAGYRYHKALQAAQALREEECLQSPPSKAQTPSKKLAKVFDLLSKGVLTYRLAGEDASDELAQLPDTNANPEEVTLRKENLEKIKGLLETLPEKERFIIEQYYFYGKSFVEISDENPELSRSWISRLHTRALEKMRGLAWSDEVATENLLDAPSSEEDPTE